ncbi:hypothetical protein SLEP1_g41920 [Rubroshorea leprosula]|uniref:Uncharacterized protein n=1 Tax=Rubroshorea leprosula TaxID=152421 RepID=A0AAV5L918_9ROSI|nr:hypothetical protein SLEP1_g41920 [Rubroshorea leprosula]
MYQETFFNPLFAFPGHKAAIAMPRRVGKEVAQQVEIAPMSRRHSQGENSPKHLPPISPLADRSYGNPIYRNDDEENVDSVESSNKISQELQQIRKLQEEANQNMECSLQSFLQAQRQHSDHFTQSLNVIERAIHDNSGAIREKVAESRRTFTAVSERTMEHVRQQQNVPRQPVPPAMELPQQNLPDPLPGGHGGHINQPQVVQQMPNAQNNALGAGQVQFNRRQQNNLAGGILGPQDPVEAAFRVQLSSSTPISKDINQLIDLVQETYGSALRPLVRPSYHKPYPDYIDRDNPFPRGFKVPEFTLFSGDTSQSTIEHIGRFTIQCGEASGDDFLKLRLFPSSLTGTALTWYLSLLQNSVFTWRQMEDLFHIQFYRSEPEISMADLSRLTQRAKGIFRKLSYAEARHTDHSHMVKPPQRPPSKRWEKVVHPKFPKEPVRNPRTLRRRLQRKRAEARRHQQLATEEVKVPQCSLAKGKMVWKRKESQEVAAQNESQPKVPPHKLTSLIVNENELKATFEADQQAELTSDDNLLEDMDVLQIGSISINLSCLVLTLPLVFQAKGSETTHVPTHVSNGSMFVEEEMIEVPAQEEEEEHDILSEQIIFNKPDENVARHIKPLYSSAHMDGVPVNRVMVDNEATVNVIPSFMLRNLGKNYEDLVYTDVTISDFTSGVSKSKEVLPVALTVGSKTSMSAFFVVDSSVTYNALLGRDWIHSNWCVPSSLHQRLIFWNGGKTEVVYADNRPFLANSNMVEARYYDEDVGTIHFFGMDRQGRPRGITACNKPTLAKINKERKEAVSEILKKLATYFAERNTEANLSEVVHEGEKDTHTDGVTMKELDLAPAKLDDLRADVQDPLKEVNLGTEAEPRIAFVSLDRELVEHRLPINKGYKPYKQPPHRMSPEVILKVKEEVERLHKVGFIRTARYSKWLSNMVPIVKKNGKLRVCIDFRNLNLATPKDEYPMPVADLLVDGVARHRILSFMDGHSGYNQIFIAEEDISKTAFRCPGNIGTYEWVVMPFGLKNAGATYQQAMNAIFHDMIGRFMEIYIDDVVVKSMEDEEHLEHLRKAFERMRQHGLKMNPLKCAFGVTAGNFLGFLVHERGLEMDKNKARAVIEARPPQNKKELQRFLGQVNFLRRFISNLAGKTRVFSPLLKLQPDADFKWERQHQAAFDAIKEYLSKPPVLVPPAVKGQALADFLADHPCLDVNADEDKGINLFSIDLVPWRLIFDGSSTDQIFGAGIIIVSPDGIKTQWCFQLDFECTNNQAEYEALVIGLELLVELKVPSVEIVGDSQLVLKQLSGEYKCTSVVLSPYFATAIQLLEEFDDVSLKHIPRNMNVEANELAQIASSVKMPEGILEKVIVIEKRMLPSIHQRGITVEACSLDVTPTGWRHPIIEHLRNPSSKTSRRTRMQALNYVLLGDVLYRRGQDELLLRCLGLDESCHVMSDVHNGICGAHQAGIKMRWIIRRHASELHPIVKPWPFRGWAIDLIGKIYPPSSKGRSFIIVATDYFTEWVEARPMKKVEQGDVIKFIKEDLIHRFGLPETITSDQGTVFVGSQVEAFAKDMGFHLLNSTPHYAQANGQAEASNKIVINILEKMVDDNPRRWHELFSDTLWAYRTSQRSSTKVTPFSLTYGHDAVLPMELTARSLRIAIQNGLNSGEYNEAMIMELEDLEEAGLTALDVMKAQKLKVARAYNKRVKQKNLAEGSLVWKAVLPLGKKDPRYGKWSPNWKGPFQIHKVLKGGAYWLKSLNGELHPRKINGIYLKPYYPTVWEAQDSSASTSA